jgi:hypothetical protein
MAFLSEDDIEKILLKQFGTLGHANLPDNVIGPDRSKTEGIVERVA